MKYCGNCGTPNEDMMRFCEECGTRFPEPVSAPQPAPTPQPRVYGTETKIVQVDNDPSVINATGEFWATFGWSIANVQITHSQDTRTYTKGFADYYTGMKTVETTTINYATITLQRDKGISNYHQIAALQKEYEDLNTSLYLQDDSECPYQLNTTALVLAFLFCFPIAIYMIYKNNKEKASWKETQAIVRQRSGDPMQIRERQRQILEEASRYMIY